MILLKIWPTNGFLNVKSYNFYFHKNDVTWTLSANGLLFKNQQVIIVFTEGEHLVIFHDFRFNLNGLLFNALNLKQWNLHMTDLYITKSSVSNERFHLPQ